MAMASDAPALRVLMTRSADPQLEKIARRLGLALEARPFTEFIPERQAVVRERIQASSGDAWILTSARAVSVIQQLYPSAFDQAPAHIFCVGARTAAALPPLPAATRVHRASGGGRELVPLIQDHAPHPDAILTFLGAAEPRPEMLAQLRALGYRLQHIPVYRTREHPGAPTDYSFYTAILFGSPKAAAAFMAGPHPGAQHWVAIGPTTASSLRAHGKTPWIPPGPPSWEEMIKFVSNHLVAKT